MCHWINAAQCKPPANIPILFETVDGDIELGQYTKVLGLTCEIDKEHVYPWCDNYAQVRYKDEIVKRWMRVPK